MLEQFDADFGVTVYDNTMWSYDQYIKKISDDPNNDLKCDLKIWRNDAKYLYEKNAIIKSAIQNFASFAIGKGIFCSPRTDSVRLRKDLSEIYTNWASSCHVDGQQDLSMVLKQIVSAILMSGDVLVYVTYDIDSKMPKIDLIDSASIAEPSKRDWPTGTDCTLGVQRDSNKKIQGYYIEVEKGKFEYRPCFDKFGRFSAMLLKNPYNSGRPGSLRGTPITSTISEMVKQLRKLLDSELQANILKTKQTGILKTKFGADAANAGQVIANSIKSQKIRDVGFFIIKDTDDLTMSSGQDISNPNITSLTKNYLQQIAAPFNLPYNILFNLFEDATYSTNQTFLQIAWDRTEIWRSYIIINLLEPIYRYIVESAISNGLTKSATTYTPDLAKVDFIGKSAVGVRPKDMVEAQDIAVKTGQKSIVQVCNENGQDAYSIMEEQIKFIAERKRLLQEYGVTEAELANAEELEIKNPEITK